MSSGRSAGSFPEERVVIEPNNFRESKIPRIELTKRLYFVAFIIHYHKEKMSSRKSKKEESDTSPSDEALEEVNNHIKEAFDILKRETKKVRMEKEALDVAAKKLEHVHFSSMLKLNVGGHLFSTSLSTLNKDPGMFEIDTFIIN